MDLPLTEITTLDYALAWSYFKIALDGRQTFVVRVLRGVWASTDEWI